MDTLIDHDQTLDSYIHHWRLRLSGKYELRDLPFAIQAEIYLKLEGYNQLIQFLVQRRILCPLVSDPRLDVLACHPLPDVRKLYYHFCAALHRCSIVDNSVELLYSPVMINRIFTVFSKDHERAAHGIPYHVLDALEGIGIFDPIYIRVLLIFAVCSGEQSARKRCLSRCTTQPIRWSELARYSVPLDHKRVIRDLGNGTIDISDIFSPLSCSTYDVACLMISVFNDDSRLFDYIRQSPTKTNICNLLRMLCRHNILNPRYSAVILPDFSRLLQWLYSISSEQEAYHPTHPYITYAQQLLIEYSGPFNQKQRVYMECVRTCILYLLN